jgi:hypothetical protein
LCALLYIAAQDLQQNLFWIRVNSLLQFKHVIFSLILRFDIIAQVNEQKRLALYFNDNTNSVLQYSQFFRQSSI